MLRAIEKFLNGLLNGVEEALGIRVARPQTEKHLGPAPQAEAALEEVDAATDEVPAEEAAPKPAFGMNPAGDATGAKAPAPKPPRRRRAVTPEIVVRRSKPRPPAVGIPPTPVVRKREARKKRRRYHLGLDWGTSTTKMVLRDTADRRGENGVAFVLVPEGSSYRYPSTVVLDAGRLYFGVEAERRRRSADRTWDSLKAHAAVRRGWETEAEGLAGVTLEDLATLSVAHYAAIGLRYAEKHATVYNQRAQVAMTLSVPVASLQDSRSRREYLRVAATAVVMAMKERLDPQGGDVFELHRALELARVSAMEQLEDDELAAEMWLRPESVSAMLWPFLSPRIGEGPYTVVDIGAATTNATFFRIHGVRDPDGTFRRKGGIAFFGAATSAPGMDDYDTALAKLLGRGDPLGLRGREDRLVTGLKRTDAIDAVAGRFHDTWAEARRRAWPKAPELAQWEGLRLLMVGGGSKVAHVRSTFEDLPGYLRGKLDDFRILEELGRPGDLYEYTGGRTARPFRGDPTFLLVAYGLSFHTGDLPEVSLPHEQEMFRREACRRAFVGFEEMGYG